MRLPRVREHALRVAIRLDPGAAPSAIEVMAKDPNSVVRKSAAFESRYVRKKGVIQPLIHWLRTTSGLSPCRPCTHCGC